MYIISFLEENDSKYTKDVLNIGKFSVRLHPTVSSCINIKDDGFLDIILHSTTNSDVILPDTRSILNIDGLNIIFDRKNRNLGYIFLWDCRQTYAGTIINDLSDSPTKLNFRPTKGFISSVTKLVNRGILPKMYLNYLERTEKLTKYPAEYKGEFIAVDRAEGVVRDVSSLEAFTRNIANISAQYPVSAVPDFSEEDYDEDNEEDEYD